MHEIVCFAIQKHASEDGWVRSAERRFQIFSCVFAFPLGIRAFFLLALVPWEFGVADCMWVPIGYPCQGQKIHVNSFGIRAILLVELKGSVWISKVPVQHHATLHLMRAILWKRWEELWSTEKRKEERRHEMRWDEMRWDEPKKAEEARRETRWDEMEWHRLRRQWDAMNNFHEKLRWDEVRRKREKTQPWKETAPESKAKGIAQKACPHPIGTFFVPLYGL